MRRHFALFSVCMIAATVFVAGCASNPAPPAPAVAAVPVYNLQFNTTINLDSYRASLPAASAGGGHTRSRLGAGCGNCWTTVSIKPYWWARNYGAANFPANPGEQIALAHIVNTGPIATDMYSLKPSTEAEYDVFLVNEGGVPGWIIVEAEKSSSGKLIIVKKGKLKGCDHKPNGKSEADFRNCDYGANGANLIRLAAARGWEGLIARMLSKKSSAAITEDPGWISCTEGCCTLET